MIQIPRFDVALEPLPGLDRMVLSGGPSFGIVSIRIHFDHGTASEPDEVSGLLDVALTMLDRGTHRMPRLVLSRAFERLGASLGVRAFRTSWYVDLTVLEEYLDQALDLLLEYLTDSAFDADELSDVLTEAEEEAETALEDPGGILARMNGPVLWSGTAWEHHPDGRVETRRRIKAEMLGPRMLEALGAKAVAGIAAEDPGHHAKAVAGWMAKLRTLVPVNKSEKVRRPPIRTGAVSAARTRGGAQAALMLSAPAPSSLDESWDAVVLHNAAFGSGFMTPLVQRVRGKEGLSYGIGSTLVPDRDESLFAVQCSPQGSKAAYTASVCLDAWDRFVETPMTDTYLEQVKSYYLGTLLMRAETVRQRMGQAVQYVASNRQVSELWEHPRRLSELDAATVSAVASRYGFGTGSYIVVCALPKGISDPGWKRHFDALQREGVHLRRLR